MPVIILIMGAVRKGKTTACLELAERCRRRGLKVYGLVSPRFFLEGRLVGYDCLDLSSHVSFPLVRLKEVVEGPDWFHFGGLRYAFSTSGFERANSILLSSSEALDRSSIIFVDEFGRLEAAGQGLLPGVLRLADRLKKGGLAVFTCRPELQGSLRKLVENKGIKLLPYEPPYLEDIWLEIQRSLKSISDATISDYYRGQRGSKIMIVT
ncbi:hypothetical protein KEJ49_06920 [Candidatus Bathyarchaeota archaeon]|nr:hypothetical protein [Candidatus Bathyarchaeota archaeon]